MALNKAFIGMQITQFENLSKISKMLDEAAILHAAALKQYNDNPDKEHASFVFMCSTNVDAAIKQIQCAICTVNIPPWDIINQHKDDNIEYYNDTDDDTDADANISIKDDIDDVETESNESKKSKKETSTFTPNLINQTLIKKEVDDKPKIKESIDIISDVKIDVILDVKLDVKLDEVSDEKKDEKINIDEKVIIDVKEPINIPTINAINTNTTGAAALEATPSVEAVLEIKNKYVINKDESRIKWLESSHSILSKPINNSTNNGYVFANRNVEYVKLIKLYENNKDEYSIMSTKYIWNWCWDVHESKFKFDLDKGTIHIGSPNKENLKACLYKIAVMFEKI